MVHKTQFFEKERNIWNYTHELIFPLVESK